MNIRKDALRFNAPNARLLVLLVALTLPGYAQPFFEPFNNLKKRAVHDVWVDTDTDTKWLASERGLIRIDDESEKAVFKSTFVRKTPITNITADRRGRKWLGGYSSDLYTENEAGEWVPFDFSRRGKFIINDLETDARNHVWVATSGGGLWRVDERGKAKFYTEDDTRIRGDQVYALAIDGQQTKWVGTDDGLQSLGEDGRWDRHRFLRQGTALLWEQAENTLWVAGLNEDWQPALWKKTGYDSDWQPVTLPQALRWGRIRQIYRDPGGSIWLVGRRVAQQSKGGWEVFGKKEGFTSSAGLCIAVDAQENVWVGTEGKGLLAWIKYPPESSVAPASAPKNLDEVLAKGKVESEWLNQEIRIRIQFPQSQARIEPKYYTELNRLAEVLQKFPRLTIELAGHTDNRGRPNLNRQLSYRRAEAVKNYLVKERSIRAERIQTVGYGGTRPIADNTDEETRRLNRRVTVRFLE